VRVRLRADHAAPGRPARRDRDVRARAPRRRAGALRGATRASIHVGLFRPQRRRRTTLRALSTAAQGSISTILFTDVVDSTVLMKRLGGRARPVRRPPPDALPPRISLPAPGRGPRRRAPP